MKKLKISSPLTASQRETVATVNTISHFNALHEKSVRQKRRGPVKKLTQEEIFELYPEEAQKYKDKLLKKLKKKPKTKIIPDYRIRDTFPDIDFDDFETLDI